jgi:hypothetical protein
VFAPSRGVLPQFAVKVDLASAYWQVPLHPNLRDRFGGTCDNVSFFSWSVLPFGWSWSPFIFFLVMRCVLIVLWSRGVWVAAYMDDIVVLGATQSECARNAQLTLSLLERLGFVVNHSKSCLVPSSAVRFLGFIVILLPSRVLVQWPRDKASRVQADASRIADAGVSSPRELAALCGRVSFLRVICPVVGALTRGLDFVHQGARHWDDTLTLAPAVVSDLRTLALLAPLLASSPWVLCVNPDSSFNVTVEVDASDSGWGVRLLVEDRLVSEFAGLLPFSLLSASSAARESYGACRALSIALSNFLPASPNPSSVLVVRLICDNTAVRAVFSRGRSPLAAATEIGNLLSFIIPHSSSVLILPLWRQRALLSRADALFRLAARDM